MKLNLPIWVDQNKGLYILIFNFLPNILAFLCAFKDFKLFKQLSDR